MAANPLVPTRPVAIGPAAWLEAGAEAMEPHPPAHSRHAPLGHLHPTVSPQHVVTVRADDFEYEGRPYRSLSAIARHITGTRWNGWTFFGLRARGDA